MTEREAIYLMASMEKFGVVGFDRLMALYGSAAEAWREITPPLAGPVLAEWQAYHEPGKEAAIRRQLEMLDQEGKILSQGRSAAEAIPGKVHFLNRDDPGFPAGIRNLPDCPIGLWLWGKLPEAGRKRAAVIGARKCSEYGKNMALRIGEELAGAGIAVISGMAQGIDAISQRAVLQKGGETLAVLGTGVDVCYPNSSARLYERLKAEGGILSEYAPGTLGIPFHFPLRNRLISALSDVVIVLEARRRSGTLITVDRALEQGKDVMALPGRVDDPLSQGCNHLIRQGAYIYTAISDVLQVLEMDQAADQEQREFDALVGEKTLPPEAKKVLSCFGSDPVFLEEISKNSGIPLLDLYGILWELENSGWIRQISGSRYMRRRTSEDPYPDQHRYR